MKRNPQYQVKLWTRNTQSKVISQGLTLEEAKGELEDARAYYPNSTTCNFGFALGVGDMKAGRFEKLFEVVQQ